MQVLLTGTSKLLHSPASNNGFERPASFVQDRRSKDVGDSRSRLTSTAPLRLPCQGDHPPPAAHPSQHQEKLSDLFAPSVSKRTYRSSLQQDYQPAACLYQAQGKSSWHLLLSSKQTSSTTAPLDISPLLTLNLEPTGRPAPHAGQLGHLLHLVVHQVHQLVHLPIVQVALNIDG